MSAISLLGKIFLFGGSANIIGKGNLKLSGSSHTGSLLTSSSGRGAEFMAARDHSGSISVGNTASWVLGADVSTSFVLGLGS